jgi:hypothetical protein
MTKKNLNPIKNLKKHETHLKMSEASKNLSSKKSTVYNVYSIKAPTTHLLAGVL